MLNRIVLTDSSDEEFFDANELKQDVLYQDRRVPKRNTSKRSFFIGEDVSSLQLDTVVSAIRNVPMLDIDQIPTYADKYGKDSPDVKNEITVSPAISLRSSFRSFFKTPTSAALNAAAAKQNKDSIKRKSSRSFRMHSLGAPTPRHSHPQSDMDPENLNLPLPRIKTFADLRSLSSSLLHERHRRKGSYSEYAAKIKLNQNESSIAPNSSNNNKNDISGKNKTYLPNKKLSSDFVVFLNNSFSASEESEPPFTSRDTDTELKVNYDDRPGLPKISQRYQRNRPLSPLSKTESNLQDIISHTMDPIQSDIQPQIDLDLDIDLSAANSDDIPGIVTTSASYTQTNTSIKKKVFDFFKGNKHSEPQPLHTRKSRSNSWKRSIPYEVKVNDEKKNNSFWRPLYCTQERDDAHKGPIWIMEFSYLGKHLATAGEDKVIRIWSINNAQPLAPTEALTVDNLPTNYQYIDASPKQELSGHTAAITGLSWSKNDFILSCSMDKSIRLWHRTTSQCLRVFSLSNLATTVNFHPFDENVFLAGFLDGTVRLFSIVTQKLLSSAQTGDVVSASVMSPDGKQALIGTYSGCCKFYNLFSVSGQWSLSHTTHMDIRASPYNNVKGRKVCSMTFLPNQRELKVAVSCNDSLIRILRTRDKDIKCMIGGHANFKSHFKTTFSADAQFMSTCSENKRVYIWKLDSILKKQIYSSYESFQPFENHDGACAVSFGRSLQDSGILCVASYSGHLKVFQKLA